MLQDLLGKLARIRHSSSMGKSGETSLWGARMSQWSGEIAQKCRVIMTPSLRSQRAHGLFEASRAWFLVVSERHWR